MEGISGTESPSNRMNNEEERKSSMFSKKSKFGRKRETKNAVKPIFVLSRNIIKQMARFKAYNAIASLVSRDYFICGDDCEFVAGD